MKQKDKNFKKNSRKHSRLTISIDAEVNLNERKMLRGVIENVSFAGAFLGLQQKVDVKVNDTCRLFLILEAGERSEKIYFECRVAHVQNSGIGLQFISTDLESYEHFKNLMVLNSSTPDELLDELRRNPGLELNDNDI